MLALLGAVLPAHSARANRCLSGMYDNTMANAPAGYVGAAIFPNWNLAWVGSYDIWLYDTTAGAENIKGVTIVNFAGTGPTAAQAVTDIKNVYVRAQCATADTGYLTLTYAGLYSHVDDMMAPLPVSLPAWTWAGTGADLGGCAEFVVGAGAVFSFDVYVDVASCARDGREVWMGIPYNQDTTQTYFTQSEGGISDNTGSWWCEAPDYELFPTAASQIHSVFKSSDVQYAAPGDTVSFTIFYGRPGAAATLSGIDIIDSLPPYMHYVGGSAIPPPVAGWDPAPGPPL
ncbi:MAG: hypothetical protein AAB368_00050, partial [bacterium]